MSTAAGWTRVGLAVALVAILLTVVTPVRAQSAPSPDDIGVAGVPDPWSILVAEASQRFDVPETWIRAVMQIESAGDARAVSSRGAIGLMQIMPGTYADLRTRYGLGADPYDPRDNILAGAAYLREMQDRFGTPGFLAAYNAGPVRYEDHLATGRPLPEETRGYVATLAPVVAGEQPLGILTAASRTVPWTDGPLFIDRPDRPAADRVVPKGMQPDRGPVPNAATTIAALVPRVDGLFVRSVDVVQP